MRIAEDTRKTVVFLGIETPNRDGHMEFVGAGTGFWMQHDGCSHLLTCRHVAKALDGMPFVIRCNLVAGGAVSVPFERMEWFYHTDETVDVAGVTAGLAPVADWRVIHPSILLTPQRIEEWHVGPGDLAYVVGLFRLLTGTQQNLPIVHSGNIALMPGSERVPVKNTTTGRVENVEGFLVEVHSLDGLSGSPVFARPTWKWEKTFNSETKLAVMPGDAYLLGMWQSAWGGEPSKEIAERFAGLGRPVSVPLGLGVVVPTTKITEVLDMPDMKKHRERLARESATNNAATTQGAPFVREQQQKAVEAEPGHRERFNRLLGAAVKSPKSSD